MIDLGILRKHGLTDENLRRWLDGDPLNKTPEKALKSDPVPMDADEATRQKAMTALEKRKSLVNRIRSRIQEGQTRNLADYKLYYALDVAWETPFRQITPTIVSTFMETDPNNDAVYTQVQNWGLSNLITETKDAKSGKPIKQFNLPVFFNVLVPLVKSYVTIRWAKIMNDRRRVPLFTYEPVKITAPMSVKCDVITDRVQIMSNQYGYFDVLKQAVLHMLHYSQCFMFPTSEWHSEEQLRYATEEDVAAKKTKENEAGEIVPVEPGVDEIRVTVREGIEYHQPHPTRTFYDLSKPPYTLNYGYGCEFAGYWRIVRYRDILNSNFWNKDKIALGNVDIVNQNQMFFQTVYTACKLSCAVAASPMPTGGTAAATLGVGAGPQDREKELANLYYGTEHGDQGVLQSEYFEKLIPADNGLGDYPYPVWFRFVVAGDGCSVMYAAPLAYDPTIYFGYDADESRSKNASLSLEVLPFQDQFSNLLTQIILTAKQNLANMTLVDEDQLTEGAKAKIGNLGESYYRFLNIFGYSGKKAFRGQNKVTDVAYSVNLPKGNTAELIYVLKTILDVLERVLVMSSQEVGQAASHEQTQEEIRNISSHTSSRLMFTAIPVDIACDAWKRQLYKGLMAHGDDDIYAKIPSELPLSQEALTAMGFTFIDKDIPEGPRTKFVQVRTTKQRTAIPLWEIAATRDSNDRVDKEKLAVGMATFLDKLLSNPITAPAIGADQAIEFTNYICKLAGLPMDAKFRNMTPQAAPMPGAGAGPEGAMAQEGGAPPDAQAAAQGQLKQVIDIVLQQVAKGMQQELQPLLDQTAQNSKDILEIGQQLQQLMQIAQTAINPNPNDSTPDSAPVLGAGPTA